jgi:hypothetical protein
MRQLMVVDSAVVGRELDRRGIVQCVRSGEQTASGLYKLDS